MPVPNPARGEVVVPLAGAPRRLCLTLGALARIEAVLRLDDWSALPERFGRLSASELLAVLAALLEGGGEDPAVLDAAPVSIPESVAAVAAALAACA
ncbi:GTA-gp10 family protein [Caulobacter sp. BK020]|uniref:GTA-gp10 family protein n=1 Tax=Caulobacter sp. BK020 TaxID=2512117 RepID=UPI0010450CEC|nr:GTA-gp10 family protein [Caulobacter sp. BK020]TCS12114.1 tail tube GTA-gp10-like protein [Caulobacter sp. BK020]